MLSTHSIEESPDQTPELSQPKVLVFSLDFDGCIFNDHYLYHPENKNRLIESNKKLINFIVHEIQAKHFDRIIFMVGSNRQSYELDQANIVLPHKGSCFPEMTALVQEIEKRAGVPCTLDTYLLADSYGDKPVGDTFARSLAGETNGFSSYVWDTHKYSILYAQIHKIASENSTAKIYYNFFDDKYKPILRALFKFYNRERGLLPRNLKKLKLFTYDGDVLYQFPENHSNISDINGTGPIDYFYKNNLSIMAKSGDYLTDDLSTAQYVTDISNALPDTYALQKFKQNRLLHPSELSIELANVINALFLKPVAGISKSDLEKLSNALQDLQKDLAKDIAQQMAKNLNINIIQNNAAVKIEKDLLKMLWSLSSENTNSRTADITTFINTYAPKSLYGQMRNLGISANYTQALSQNGITFYKPAPINIMTKARSIARHLEAIQNKSQQQEMRGDDRQNNLSRLL